MAATAGVDWVNGHAGSMRSSLWGRGFGSSGEPFPTGTELVTHRYCTTHRLSTFRLLPSEGHFQELSCFDLQNGRELMRPAPGQPRRCRRDRSPLLEALVAYALAPAALLDREAAE